MVLPVVYKPFWGERCHPLPLAHHPVQDRVILVACECHNRASVGLRGEGLIFCPFVGAYPVQRDGAFDSDSELVGFVAYVSSEIALYPICVLKVFRQSEGFFVRADIAYQPDIIKLDFLS